MTLRLDQKAAKATLRSVADEEGEPSSLCRSWMEKVTRLSELCEVTSKTHIAFFGTAALAKSIDPRADLFAIKPTHAEDKGNAFSARSLCHSVLVPLSAELGFSIGVTGREPLNNQPYFRMKRLDDGTPVRGDAKAAFQFMVELIREMQEIDSREEARSVLRAFIEVRRKYLLTYALSADSTCTSWQHLLVAIESFVSENSEGGRRAQAVVAALIDTVVGEDRVESGRVNDPSRHGPGDVSVLSPAGDEEWDKAFEVRDKPVRVSDVFIFGRKCIAKGVQEIAVVAVSKDQAPLESSEIESWATTHGVKVSLFLGWREIVEQSLFWANAATPVAVGLVARQVEYRLASVEASPASIDRWRTLLS